MSHTPGPWEWGVNHSKGGVSNGAGASNRIVVRPRGEFPHGEWVADCGRCYDDIAKANARLIAAAPELLEALEWAMQAGRLDYVERNKQNADYCERVDSARAAIAKAKGATP